MTYRLVQAIVLVEDLEAARAGMEALGFGVAEGGRHPGRGTANLIVPFGSQYLELLAVVDRAEALASPQGRAVLAALTQQGFGLARWSVEDPDIASTAARLGYPVERRHRLRPDGVTVAWQSVAVDAAWAEPWLCAYMAWDDDATHPARTTVTHPNGATGFAELLVEGPDDEAVRSWLGGPAPEGVTILPPGQATRPGRGPGPRGLLVSAPEGPVVVA